MEIIEKLPDAWRQKNTAENLIGCLPSRFNNKHDGEDVPEHLLGATILRMGTFPNGGDIQGGGLVIEYRPKGSKSARRIIFEFDERDMRIHSDVVISSAKADQGPGQL